MEVEILDSDIARNSAPSYHDTARHSLTITQASELFAQLGVPRSKRSVQRFCEQGHLDCVRIKGARGDHFLSIANPSRVTRKSCAKSKQSRASAPKRATARYS